MIESYTWLQFIDFFLQIKHQNIQSVCCLKLIYRIYQEQWKEYIHIVLSISAFFSVSCLQKFLYLGIHVLRNYVSFLIS